MYRRYVLGKPQVEPDFLTVNNLDNWVRMIPCVTGSGVWLRGQLPRACSAPAAPCAASGSSASSSGYHPPWRWFARS